MKKILTITLILACMLAFASCTFGGDPANAFISAVASTDPDTATITTVTSTELGELNGEYVITYGDEGAASIAYSYEQWYKVGEGNGTDTKYTVTGTITRQPDGSYADGKGFTASADSIVAGFSLDLSSIIADAEINNAGDTLNATVTAANTEAVLGVELDYDVDLTVIIGGGMVERISVTFEDDGNTGSITCRYR